MSRAEYIARISWIVRHVKTIYYEKFRGQGLLEDVGANGWIKNAS